MKAAVSASTSTRLPTACASSADSGQNLRHNVNIGGVTLVDGALNNGAVPPVAVTGVAAAAYTNNDNAVATTGTVLFDISATAGTLLVQIPPNSGGTSLIGALGVSEVIGRVGFDIYTVTNRAGATVSNLGYASIAGASGASQLYSVDLSSGVASALGQMRAVHRWSTSRCRSRSKSGQMPPSAPGADGAFSCPGCRFPVRFLPDD